MRVALLAGMILVGCGNGETTETGPKVCNCGVDAAFNDTVDLFQNMSGQHFANSLYFVDSIPDNAEGQVAGLCLGYDIEISRVEWNKATPDEQEATILHELGHCQLWRAHKTDKTTCPGENYEAPVSLMYPIIAGDCYSKNKQWYWNELLAK
jgi:hypothetical protein